MCINYIGRCHCHCHCHSLYLYWHHPVWMTYQPSSPVRPVIEVKPFGQLNIHADKVVVESKSKPSVSKSKSKREW